MPSRADLAGGRDHPLQALRTLEAALGRRLGQPLGRQWRAKSGGGPRHLPFALSFERVGDIVATWSLLAAMAYLVLIVSVFAYLLWFHLLSVSGATAASSYHFLMPPLGLLFGWLLLGEPVAAADLLGIVPVAFGIYLVARPAAPAHTGSWPGRRGSCPPDPRPRRGAPGHGRRAPRLAAASPPRPAVDAGHVGRAGCR